MAFKRFIVGNTSYSFAMQNNLALVDKTRFIERLDNENSLVPVFLRPRRFGKSLLVDTLYCYYDKSMEGDFEQNFKGTWIYSHKTPKASSYYCLRFDFSSVSSNPSKVEKSVALAVEIGLSDFTDRYPELGLPYEELKQSQNYSPDGLIKDFVMNFKSHAKEGEKLFILIDEYDHFANDLLSSDKEAFKEITSTAQDHEGSVKQFYATLKQFYGGSRLAPIERFFITGVSAVSLDSLISGFNIATNISTDPQFNAMAGFTHDELSRFVDETVDFSALAQVTKDELMSVMERYYDGYSFSNDGQERVFNSNMCLVFLSSVMKAGRLPKIMPGNAGDDAVRLDGLLKLSDPETNNLICSMIFSREDIANVNEPGELNLNRSNSFDFSQAVWMLYYLGYLTMSNSDGIMQYRCPNEITYQAFADYLAGREGFRTTSTMDLNEILRKGDIESLARLVEKSIAEPPDAAFSGFNERGVQLCFHYVIKWQAQQTADSFPEADTGDHGRADLYVKNKAGGPDLLLEFKYISKSKADDAKVAKALATAKAQLEQYKDGPKFKGNGNLKAYAMVFVGPKVVRIEEA